MHVLIADPRPLWRLGLRTALTPSCGVSEATSVDETLAALPSADVVVLGGDFAETITETVTAARLLVVAPPDGPLAQRLFGRDVAGYLPETATAEAVLDALQAVAAGARRWFVTPRPLPPFSEREAEVIALLADGRSNGEIAEALKLSVSTVRTHLANASAKVGASTAREAIAWAWRHAPPRPPQTS